jgi:hypothetical protein
LHAAGAFHAQLRGSEQCIKTIIEGVMKTTVTYWNPLEAIHSGKWEDIEGSEGNLKQITLAIDHETGDYTRLTWFRDGYHTGVFGARAHPYPEEIFVVSGRLYDEAFAMWLAPGHYASRPPGEVHGPFTAEGDVIIFEQSFPSQSIVTRQSLTPAGAKA